MKELFALTLAFAFARPATLPQTGPNSKDKVVLVHFVAVNMSGAPREVLHGRDLVTLPVAERVSLQVPAGESIEITSRTDTKVKELLAIVATDEGRTIPIR